MARKDANPGMAEAAAERRLKALQLRTAGMPYRAIATQLGVSHQQAYEDVQRELKAIAEQSAEEAQAVRQLDLERLDAMTIAIWGQVRAGNLGAIDRALRISERRAKLLGIDAPEKRREEPTPPIDWSRVDEAVHVDFLEGRISLADVIKQLR
jgi:hypothetical protein